ncbi:MAG: magnesium transporter [Deltaproteobacteria bacterium]|nr:magnesium transporter [Deltaproteobacteria bacterium]
MKNPFLAPELREIVEKNDDNALQAFCASLHPASVADFLGALSSQEIWHVLVLLEPRLRAEIFGALDQDLQGELIESLNRQDLAQIVNHMSADERVDLLKRMPDDRQETLMPVLAQAEREDIRRLSSYPEGTAGAAMTSDYATLPPDQTVREALSKLRREAPDKETIYYSYVLDPDRRLIGFLSLKDLIIARPDRRIEELMHRDLIYAVVSDDQEDAARKIAKYDLIALPVVNGNRELVGIITHDDAIDIINQEHTEDMEKFMAIAGSHETGAYLRTSSWGHFKNRCIWLVALAALGLVSGYIVQSFEGLLLQFAILATFMPMLADTGGNTGSQSATLIVRALAVREISPGDILRVLWKEFKVGLPMAFLLAAAKMKFDPAVVASPALTTIVDITGLFIYFTTAKLLLGI